MKKWAGIRWFEVSWYSSLNGVENYGEDVIIIYKEVHKAWKFRKNFESSSSCYCNEGTGMITCEGLCEKVEFDIVTYKGQLITTEVDDWENILSESMMVRMWNEIYNWL